MEFIDSTGHIFELEDYNFYPEGYDYNENQYVFWFDNEYNTKLSIDCYYIKPIRIIYNKKLTKKSNINISIEKSNHYKLLSSKKIQELLENKKDIFSSNVNDYIEIDDNVNFVNKLSFDDLCIVNDISQPIFRSKQNPSLIYHGNVNEILNVDNSITYIGNNGYEEIELIKDNVDYTLIPFYVVANVKEEGSWLTNILIHIEDNDYTLGQINTSYYCPITVGGVFYNEMEELVINGKNMGVSFPKEIIRSFYNTSFYNDNIDYSIWNNKIKEYLLNYMKLKGELGNFRQILYSLDWFGYGDKLSISKLLKTDNELINQYITDNFSISTDIINSFLTFKNTTYISLSLKGITYDNENYNMYNFEEDFWGEGKPKLINLFNTFITEKIDDTSDIEFIKQYYDFGFNELGLKLSCLKYYFEKYFLPIHIKIYRSSITNQCFSQDIKILNNVYTQITSNSLYVNDNNVLVNFPISDTLWISNQTHFIDDNFTEFSLYNNSEYYKKSIDNIYYFEDLCVSIPIEFSSNNYCDEYDRLKHYNVNIILFRNDEKILDTKFNFYNKTSFYDKYTNEKYINNDIIIHNNNYVYIDSDNNIKQLTRECLTNDFKYIVIYPKLLGENNNVYDWLNSNYSLRVLVNNKWFEYSFKLKLPELDIRVGTLYYQYNYNMFKQFNGINENNILQFNAKMYEPDLVTINNVDFVNNLIMYMKNNHLTYINKQISILKDNNYKYYINKNGYKCIYSIIEEKQNIYKYYILTEDPNYFKYENIENLSNNNNLLKLYEINNIEELMLEFNEKIQNNECYYVLHKDINSFVDLYNEQINLPNDINKLLNRVHLFNLLKINEDGNPEYIKYDNTTAGKNSFSIQIELNNELKQLCFADNDSEYVINLYKAFFDINTGNINCNFNYIENNNRYIDNSLKQNYDLYLMHDEDYWYIVLISKSPIVLNQPLDIPKYSYEITNEYYNNYYLQYVRSDNKFLVNRVIFKDSNGIHQFNNNDVIVCKIENIDLPINLMHNSKWTINPLSIGINNFKNVSSNNNMCIISTSNNTKYERGYYEIKVTYALDKNLSITEEKTTKILIK